MSATMLKKAMTRCKENAFSRPAYTVDLPLDDIVGAFLRFLNRELYRSLGSGMPADVYVEGIFERVPPFQRDNDKWTPTMQSAFIRNVLLGMKANPVLFYSLDGSNSNCYILDGLQRMTATIRFFTDPDMEIDFGKGVVLKASEILSDSGFMAMLWNLVLPLKIYQFKSEVEAVEHYIEFNDQITHAQEDILKAQNYLAAIK